MSQQQPFWDEYTDLHDDGDPFWGEPISVYTREQAIEDGVLVDVTDWASAEKGMLGGFTIPVAITQALWNRIEQIPKGSGEDVRGRAHDVLWMARQALIRGGQPSTTFIVIITRRRVQLRVVVDGDGATIGFPEDF